MSSAVTIGKQTISLDGIVFDFLQESTRLYSDISDEPHFAFYEARLLNKEVLQAIRVQRLTGRLDSEFSMGPQQSLASFVSAGGFRVLDPNSDGFSLLQSVVPAELNPMFYENPSIPWPQLAISFLTKNAAFIITFVLETLDFERLKAEITTSILIH